VGRTELGVVEEESSLSSGFLFEGDSGILSLAALLDLDASNLSTDRR
jgi:hypothetical protein